MVWLVVGPRMGTVPLPLQPTLPSWAAPGFYTRWRKAKQLQPLRSCKGQGNHTEEKARRKWALWSYCGNFILCWLDSGQLARLAGWLAQAFTAQTLLLLLLLLFSAFADHCAAHLHVYTFGPFLILCQNFPMLLLSALVDHCIEVHMISLLYLAHLCPVKVHLYVHFKMQVQD